MKQLLLLCTLLVGVCKAQIPQVFHLRAGIQPNEYVANTLVFKVQPQYRQYCTATAITEPRLKKALQNIGAVKLSKAFPQAQPVNVDERSANNNQPLVDLSLIYQLKYRANAVGIEHTINQLLATGVLVYAEPRYVAKNLYIPNDSAAVDSVEYYLSAVHAYQAWDVTKGDTNVVIGITDTGTDTSHIDLKGNLQHNYKEIPNNGIDDDGDGFIDNYIGWNFEDNNSNPSDSVGHGTAVCGMAAAVTNNSHGIASVGFKCRFLPIKMDFNNPFQSVVYAADHGCSVINCSWGEINYSALGEDAVNYATVNKNALVVGASGNNGNYEIFYPAGYTNAMCVGATMKGDARAAFSDYNYTVAVMAPGFNVYTTALNGKYGNEVGTSFAAPMAAAGAALIKSNYPNYTALQLREQLRVTADNIDTIPANVPYAHKMGSGRIDLAKALTTTSPSVRWINRVITDGNDNVFNVGDTVRLSGDFINYLAPATGLTITITCGDPNVSILNGTWTVGNLNTLKTANNNTTPFTFKINAGIAYETKLQLKLTYTAVGYTDEEWVEVIVQPDFINVTVNDIATTITSRGRLGYNDHYVNGLGFVYKNNGEELITEMGLMVGVPRRHVDNGQTGIYVLPDSDFIRQVAIHKVIPSVKSDMDLDGSFTDGLTDTTKLQIEVHQKVYVWGNTGDRNYYIIQYTIINKSARIYDSLFAGIYADWQMGSGLNRTNVDTALKLGYTYDPQGNHTYTGIKLMTGQGFHSYGVDFVPGGYGGVNFFKPGYYGYYDSDKFTMLSTNRYKAGFIGGGNSVAQMVSSGPYHLPPNDSIALSFIVIAADDSMQLMQTATRAISKYNGVAEIATKLNANTFAFPNPTKTLINLCFTANAASTANIAVYNVTGALVKTLNTPVLQQGLQQIVINTGDWNEGLYFYQVSTTAGNFKGKFVVVK